MTKRLFQKLVTATVQLWFFTMTVSFAQAPTTDLESITEDSYQRMQARQAGEQGDLVYPNFVAPSYDGTIETYSVPDVPIPRGKGLIGYISDPKNFIVAASEQRINELLYELEQKSSVEVAVVMLPSIGEEIPKNFAAAAWESFSSSFGIVESTNSV